MHVPSTHNSQMSCNIANQQTVPVQNVHVVIPPTGHIKCCGSLQKVLVASVPGPVQPKHKKTCMRLRVTPPQAQLPDMGTHPKQHALSTHAHPRYLAVHETHTSTRSHSLCIMGVIMQGYGPWHMPTPPCPHADRHTEGMCTPSRGHTSDQSAYDALAPSMQPLAAC